MLLKDTIPISDIQVFSAPAGEVESVDPQQRRMVPETVRQCLVDDPCGRNTVA
ncbi:hypothetical protein MY10362_001450 [Beauveria mimosiformis]